MNRPNISKCSKEVIEYIEYLEKIKEAVLKEFALKSYDAQMKKIEEISDILMTMPIKLTDDKGDKELERQKILWESLPKITKDAAETRKLFTPEEEEKVKQKVVEGAYLEEIIFATK